MEEQYLKAILSITSHLSVPLELLLTIKTFELLQYQETWICISPNIQAHRKQQMLGPRRRVCVRERGSADMCKGVTDSEMAPAVH